MNPPPKKTKISEQSFRESFREGGDLEYSNSSFDFTITIVNTFQKEVNQKLTFKDCSFKKIELFNLNFNSKIYFFNCDIDEDFIVNNCVFKESFRIFYVTAKSLRIWSNDFLSGIDIYDFKKLENLILQINKALGRVHVKQWHVNPIEVQSIHITFENITECSILLEGFVSQKIEIQFSGQFLTDRIRITDFKAKELNIYKLKIKANNNVDIARIESAKVFFLWLHNDGWLSISDFKSSEEKKGTLFSIQESYFGNAELYHINLDSFEKVQIFNCHVQNIIPVNVKWNFNIKAYEGIKGEYLRELFRQLKNVCSKNMDKASQLRFESMEMHFYSKQLHWKKNFQDWFILKSNQVSNNHGNNWLLPLGWLLLFSFCFYTVINFVANCFENYHIGNYFAFIFPLHNINDLLYSKTSKIQHQNAVRFWDVLQKLFSSYFIFQFLRSFRKYVN